MSLNIINRIQEAKEQFLALNDAKAKQKAMEDAARAPAERMLAYLKANSTRGRVEPDYETPRGTISHGRASLRLHGMTLEQGWLPILMEGTPTGADFTIINKAPHTIFGMRGAKEHPIPGPVSFYWFKKSNAYLFLRGIPKHPGMAPFIPLQRAVEQNRPYMRDALRWGVLTLLSKLRQFFRK